MRGPRIVGVVVILCLLTIANLPQTVNGQTTPWIDKNAATEYATNLIDNLNTLVVEKYGQYPNSTVAKAFPLFHESHDSFNVTVVRWSLIHPDLATFLFTHIASDTPQVYIKNTTFLDMLLPGKGANSTFVVNCPTCQYGFDSYFSKDDFRSKVTFIPLVWVAYTSSGEMNNPLEVSASVAHFLFDKEQTALLNTTSTAQRGPSDIFTPLNDLVTIIVLVTVIGGAIGAYRNKSVRQKVEKWWHGG
ncbi:MAG: hypothetical protein HY247_02610 [archaeon]|nr:MAG: hypothetical protein HY247_02610 [archaeon]